MNLNFEENATNTYSLETQLYFAVTNLGALISFLALVFNTIVLVYIVRLLYRKTNDFMIQMIFVSIIDAGAGLLYFSTTRLFVKDSASLTLCALFLKSSVAFHLMSKGNMLCISIQRYIFARKLRQTENKWRQTNTVAIMSANITFGVLVGLAHKQADNFISEAMPVRLCSPLILVLSVGFSTSLVFWLGFLVLLSSDVLCLLTIRKLMLASNSVYPLANETTQNTLGRLDTDTVQWSTCRRHRHATVTILIILIVFTCSSLPLLVRLGLQQAYGMEFTPIVIRLCFLPNYFPLIVNPVLIMMRTQGLRQAVREDISYLMEVFIQFGRSRCIRN